MSPSRACSLGILSNRSPVPGRENAPAWLFPVPVRPSRFVFANTAWRHFNIEVAQDRIAPFTFRETSCDEVLWYDLQTQLNGGYPGRHGSGRAGIYRGFYLKGVGRTPAAANWNTPGDLYHGSGHLSVASAVRERVISAVLVSRGLGDSIVPCQGLLLGKLSSMEARAVSKGASSSRAGFAAADGSLMALTAKPADFARFSNVVFALIHNSGSPADLGQLFLDLEYFLNPPVSRTGLQGEPESIVSAMNAAFERGLRNFRSFSQIGLFWTYLNSNFTLDGRFMDLETPLYFGEPFLGILCEESEGAARASLLGFEEFGFVLHWRLFLSWMISHLRLLLDREQGLRREVRAFLRDFLRTVRKTFSADHLLLQDRILVEQAARFLSCAIGCSRQHRGRILELSRYAFATRVYGADLELPGHGWKEIGFAPAPMTPYPRSFQAAGYLNPLLSADAAGFKNVTEELGAMTNPAKMLRAMDFRLGSMACSEIAGAR